MSGICRAAGCVLLLILQFTLSKAVDPCEVPPKFRTSNACRPVREIRAFQGCEARSVAFSHNGRRLAFGCKSSILRIFQLDAMEAWAWKEVHFDKFDLAWKHFHRYITSVAFSPDDTMLAGGSWDVKPVIWQVNQTTQVWKLAARLDEGATPLRALAWSPDGRMLATCGDTCSVLRMVDDDVRRWQSLAQVVDVPGKTFYAVDFSPDGQWLAVGGSSRTVQLWNVSGPVDSWGVQRILVGHAGMITRLAFCFRHEALKLVTASSDLTARVWDLTSSDPAEWHTEHILKGHGKAIVAVAFSPDGYHVATGSADRTVRIWSLKSSKTSLLRPVATISYGLVTKRTLGLVHDLAWSVEDLLATSSGEYSSTASRIWDVKDFDLGARRDTLFGPDYTSWRSSHLQSLMGSFHMYPHSQNSTTGICDLGGVVRCTTVRMPCSPGIETAAVDLDLKAVGRHVDTKRVQCALPGLPPIRHMHLMRLHDADNAVTIPAVCELSVDHSSEWGGPGGSIWLTNLLKLSAQTLQRLDIADTSFGGHLEAAHSEALPFLSFLNISGTQVETLDAEWILGRTVITHGAGRLKIPGIQKTRSQGEMCDSLPERPCFMDGGDGKVIVQWPPYKDGLLLMDLCEPGYEGPGLGSPCSTCNVGYWSGGLPCQPCGVHQTTLRSGSTSKRDCLCYSGYLMQDGSVCGLCPQGFDCTMIGTELWTASVLPGYWRSSSSTTAVKCSSPQRCTGGPPGHLCRLGHTGAKCDECLDGYFLASGGFCTLCFQSFRNWGPFLLVLLAGLVTLLGLVVWSKRKHGAGTPGAEPPSSLSVAVLHLKDRVLALLNACQLLALVGGSHSVVLRPGRNFNLLLFETREITDPLRPACWLSYRLSMELNLVVACAQPLLLCLGAQLVILAVSSNANQRLSRMAKLLPDLLGMTLTGALAGMSRLLECERMVPQGDEPWVKRLSFVQCRSTEHTVFSLYAVSLVSIYVVISLLVFKLPAAHFTGLAEALDTWTSELKQEECDLPAVTIFTCAMHQHPQAGQLHQASAPRASSMQVVQKVQKVVDLASLEKRTLHSPLLLDSEAGAVASHICALAVLAVRGAVEMALLNQSGVENAVEFVTLRVGRQDLRGSGGPSLVVKAPAESSRLMRTAKLELSATEERKLETVVQQRLLLIHLRQRQLAPFLSNLSFLTKYHPHARHFDSILKVTAGGFAFALTINGAAQQAFSGVILSCLTILQLFFGPWVLHELTLTALVTYGAIASLFVLALLDELNMRPPLFLSKVTMALPFIRFLVTSTSSAIPRLRRQSVQQCLEELILSMQFQLVPLAERAVKELTVTADCVPSVSCPEDIWGPDWRSSEAGAMVLEVGTAVVPLLRCGALLEVWVLEGHCCGRKGWLPVAVLRAADSRGLREVELQESCHKGGAGTSKGSCDD